MPGNAEFLKNGCQNFNYMCIFENFYILIKQIIIYMC